MTDFRIVDLKKEDFDFILEAVKLRPLALKLEDATNNLLEKLILQSMPEGEDKEKRIHEKKMEEILREAKLRKEEENSILIASKIILLKQYFEKNGYLGSYSL